jgi:hypothetical protein
MHSYAASSYIWLEQYPAARTAAQAALATYQAASPEDRSPSREAIARLDLALAMTALGAPDEACVLGQEALGSERVVDSVLVRAWDLARALSARCPTLPEARELVEQVRSAATNSRKGDI